ncbi:ankyrin repeat-containing domain protein [Sporodiniella umbellata]|nr:ankyrin repeat-containing domain protein [Sporodiniella umbellata]
MSLPPVPRTKKHQKVVSIKEMYVAIGEVECSAFQERLKTIMDKTVLGWTERYESLVNTIEELEQSKRKIKHQSNIQLQHYEKAIKEVKFYRDRYNNLVGRRASSTSTKTSSSVSIVSDAYSETYTPRIEEKNTYLTAPYKDNKGGIFDVYSVKSGPITTSPSMPASPVSPTLPQPYSTTEDSVEQMLDFSKNKTNFKEPPKEVLKFACSDGFWKAISQGKSNKEEINTLVSNFLKRGGSPNVAKVSETVKSVKEGYSLVHALVATKNTASLQLVLQAGADPNVLPLSDKEEDQISPLILAAKVGHLNGIRLLVELAAVNLYDSKGPRGESVLHAAVLSNSEEIVEYLLHISENRLLEKTDSFGATAIHYAAMGGNPRLISLISKGCLLKLDAQDNKGEVPIHYAIRNRKIKAVTRLIELGACLNVYISKQVPTPLDLARAGGLDSIARYLKQAGAKTTKEMEQKNSTVTSCSSNSSVFSGESSGSSEISASSRSIRHYLHLKTSRIMKGK